MLAMIPAKTLADEEVTQGNADQLLRVTTLTLESDGSGLYHNELDIYAAAAETFGITWNMRSGWSDLVVTGVDNYYVVGNDVPITINLADGETRHWTIEYRAVFATKTPSCWVVSLSPAKTPSPPFYYGEFRVIVKLPPGASVISVSPSPTDTWVEGGRPCYKFVVYNTNQLPFEINYSTPECAVPEFGLSTALVTSLALMLYLPIRKRFGKAKP